MRLPLTFSLLIATGIAAAEPLETTIDRLTKPYVDSETIVGMTVGVIRGDEQAVKGFGHFSEDDSRTPDGKTVYEIGSVSKVFTGLLLADAVVAGDVTLDTAAADLLPEGVKMPSKGDDPITLRHLSTHTSGLPRLPSNLHSKNPNDPYADYNGKKLAAFLKSHRLERAPGEKAEYSNLGAGMLGLLLSRQAKTDYETLLVDRIAKPLLMDDTLLTLTDEQRARLAPPHSGAGMADHNWRFDALAGCGGIRSTTDDMLRFAAAQLDPPDDELGQAIELAWEVHQKPLDKADFAMGLGWHVARDGSTRWHNGQTGGYHAAIFANRPLKVVVVVLTNTATAEVDVLAQDLVVALAGQDVKPREFEKGSDVPDEVLKRYAGKYRLAPGADFTVSTKGGKLLVGLTGQPTFEVFSRSETEWYYKVVDATLTFQVNAAGKCTAVELFQNGQRQTAKRVQ
jgi:D-alanyl-D-alanine-carboxypeptidase/D-alanyl-D-alanine-endopeptidase